MKVFLLVLCAIISGILSHPFPTFVMTILNENGQENPTFQVNQLSTIYFKFSDLRNSLAPVSQNQLMVHHARWVHIQFASLDRELLWHVHPDDFYDVSQMGTNGTFWVQVSFPRAGFYTIAADFIFVGPTGRREGVATNFVQAVNGNAMPNNTVSDFGNTTYAATWPFGLDERYLSPIASSSNVVSSSLGIKVVLRILQNTTSSHTGMTGMHMRETTATDGNTAIVGKCSFFTLSVYWNDGTPVTTMRPYLNAAVHFTMLSSDGGLYHAHGAYLPTGMTPNEVAGMMMGMNHSDHNMTDDMMNLTMNAMMAGILSNGSLNCLSDAGAVMDDMDDMGMNMDHNLFYGPENIGPSFFGIFDWNGFGNWRLWAWMKINVNGEDRLLVPQFDVNAIWENDEHTTMHMSSMDMGAASLAYPVLLLTLLIAILL